MQAELIRRRKCATISEVQGSPQVIEELFAVLGRFQGVSDSSRRGRRRVALAATKQPPTLEDFLSREVCKKKKLSKKRESASAVKGRLGLGSTVEVRLPSARISKRRKKRIRGVGKPRSKKTEVRGTKKNEHPSGSAPSMEWTYSGTRRRKVKFLTQ